VTLRWVVFDLDGTLVDSDAALVEPFLRLGVPREEIILGRLLDDECARLGVTVEDYLARYQPETVQPFPGVEEVLRALPRWAVASHKVRSSGEAELARLDWHPYVAMFAEDFGGGHKHLAPVLDAIGAAAPEVVFVGDTDHDRSCALDAGATFALAGWNPRVVPEDGDLVLRTPKDLLGLGAGLLAR
jgi:HAD superfamily hydrolase (TIGR01549 family)